MAFSFVRAFTASLRWNLSNIKKESKRLQKSSQRIFGKEYSLNICQEAIAAAKGLRNWQDVTTFEKSIGRDKHLPFWQIDARNDAHDAALKALVYAEIESSENGPAYFLGRQADAIAPALCLWIEEASYGRVPGILLVDTKAQSLQDTPAWEPVQQFGLEDLFLHFRSVDTREACLPVALGTMAADWVRSLSSGLPGTVSETLERAGVWHVMRQHMAYHAESAKTEGERATVYFHGVEDAYRLVFSPCPQLHDASGGEGNDALDQLNHSIGKYLANRPMEAIATLGKLIDALNEKQFNLRTVLWSESAQRPTIVLFDRDQPESVVLASVIHSMYYWRYVGWELRQQGISTRPVLYFHDGSPAAIPEFIRNSSAARTIVVDGSGPSDMASLPRHEKRSSMVIHVDGDTLIANGKRVRFTV